MSQYAGSGFVIFSFAIIGTPLGSLYGLISAVRINIPAGWGHDSRVILFFSDYFHGVLFHIFPDRPYFQPFLWYNLSNKKTGGIHMGKSTVVILAMAVVLLSGGCASTPDRNKNVTAAPAEEEYAPPAAESGETGETAAGTENGIAETVKKAASNVKKTIKEAVDETAVAANKTNKEIGKAAKKFGKASADVISGDLKSAGTAAVAAVKGAGGKGGFPWWIILIILLIILLIYFLAGRKKKEQG
jgi:hypothetical protein